jgi:hypothetical protein
LSRHLEALSDWDEALRLDVGDFHTNIRVERCTNYVHIGDFRRAFAEADEIARARRVDGMHLYRLACVCSLAAERVAKDVDELDRNQRSKLYASRAVELLKLALEQGYADAAGILKDPTFDVLKERADFQKLQHDSPTASK